MKYAPGLVPVNFRLAGKILLGLGIAGTLLKGIDCLIGWTSIPNVIFYVSLALITIGIYLIFVVPKE